MECRILKMVVIPISHSSDPETIRKGHEAQGWFNGFLCGGLGHPEGVRLNREVDPHIDLK